MSYIDLTSQITGSNQSFTIDPSRYVSGSTILVLNGNVQRPGVDYNEDAGGVLIATTFTPLITDILTLNYEPYAPLVTTSGHPYSTTAQVLGPALSSLVTSAKWNKTELTGDVARLIDEGDNEIDSRLASLEIPLPFSTNPPIINSLSILYARYAVFRELFSSGQPSGKGLNPRAQGYLDQFEAKMKGLMDGTLKLVDSTGAVISGTKFATVTIPYPCPEKNVDAYPNYPAGPYPDPPGVGN